VVAPDQVGRDQDRIAASDDRAHHLGRMLDSIRDRVLLLMAMVLMLLAGEILLVHLL